MLREFSPDTPEGSFSRDLNTSKLWLCRALHKLDLVSFDSIYILGSWYGAMSLWLLHTHIHCDHMYCIDWDREKTQYVDHAMKRAHLSHKIHAVRADANQIAYEGNRILVINTSTNDMDSQEWLDNIPPGSVVVLQGRDNQALSNGVETLEKFDRMYPLTETLLVDSIVLEGVEGDLYTRFMKIGLV